MLLLTYKQLNIKKAKPKWQHFSPFLFFFLTVHLLQRNKICIVQ